MNTIRYGLERYGAVMTFAEVLAEAKISENTLRKGIATGLYPAPLSKGRFATEAVMRAIMPDNMENNDDLLRTVPEGPPESD